MFHAVPPNLLNTLVQKRNFKIIAGFHLVGFFLSEQKKMTVYHCKWEGGERKTQGLHLVLLFKEQWY